MSDLYWHFLLADGKTRFEPRQRVEVGQTLIFDGKPILCEQGLHASRRAMDALKYAPGPIVCRVELSGTVRHDTDKSVAIRRKCLWMMDATTLLHEFACDAAEGALLLADVTDRRSWVAIEVKRAWLRGEATDKELAAARDAARAAAWDAERAAAWDAARASAWDELNGVLEASLFNAGAPK